MTQPAQYISGRTVQEQMDQLIGYVDTRAAEVATDAIASDVAQVHQDMLDADADASAAAASAAAAAGTLANAVKKTGESSQSIAGDIAVAGDLSAGGDASVTGDAGVQGQLSVLGGCDLRAPVKIPVTPTNNDDAASKKYVDDKDALDVHLAGSESISGIKTVPLEPTGTFTGQIASSQKVKNELDNYAPMLRTTGNQEPIEGKKTFAQPTGWFFGSNSNAIPAGSYFNIVSIPRSSISGTRGHLAIWLKNRTRADSIVLSIYHHSSEAQDLEVVVPHQGSTTKTWTLSQDTDNIYLSFNGDNSTGPDGWFAQAIFSVSTTLSAINAPSVSDSILGTVVRSMTI